MFVNLVNKYELNLCYVLIVVYSLGKGECEYRIKNYEISIKFENIEVSGIYSVGKIRGYFFKNVSYF